MEYTFLMLIYVFPTVFVSENLWLLDNYTRLGSGFPSTLSQTLHWVVEILSGSFQLNNLPYYRGPDGVEARRPLPSHCAH